MKKRLKTEAHRNPEPYYPPSPKYVSSYEDEDTPVLNDSLVPTEEEKNKDIEKKEDSKQKEEEKEEAEDEDKDMETDINDIITIFSEDYILNKKRKKFSLKILFMQ